MMLRRAWLLLSVVSAAVHFNTWSVSSLSREDGFDVSGGGTHDVSGGPLSGSFGAGVEQRNGLTRFRGRVLSKHLFSTAVSAALIAAPVVVFLIASCHQLIGARAASNRALAEGGKQCDFGDPPPIDMLLQARKMTLLHSHSLLKAQIPELQLSEEEYDLLSEQEKASVDRARSILDRAIEFQRQILVAITEGNRLSEDQWRDVERSSAAGFSELQAERALKVIAGAYFKRKVTVAMARAVAASEQIISFGTAAKPQLSQYEEGTLLHTTGLAIDGLEDKKSKLEEGNLRKKDIIAIKHISLEAWNFATLLRLAGRTALANGLHNIAKDVHNLARFLETAARDDSPEPEDVYVPPGELMQQAPADPLSLPTVAPGDMRASDAPSRPRPYSAPSDVETSMVRLSLNQSSGEGSSAASTPSRPPSDVPTVVPQLDIDTAGTLQGSSGSVSRPPEQSEPDYVPMNSPSGDGAAPQGAVGGVAEHSAASEETTSATSSQSLVGGGAKAVEVSERSGKLPRRTKSLGDADASDAVKVKDETGSKNWLKKIKTLHRRSSKTEKGSSSHRGKKGSHS